MDGDWRAFKKEFFASLAGWCKEQGFKKHAGRQFSRDGPDGTIEVLCFGTVSERKALDRLEIDPVARLTHPEAVD